MLDYGDKINDIPGVQETYSDTNILDRYKPNVGWYYMKTWEKDGIECSLDISQKQAGVEFKSAPVMTVSIFIGNDKKLPTNVRLEGTSQVYWSKALDKLIDKAEEKMYKAILRLR